VVRHPRWRRGRSIDTDVETVGEAQLRRWQERDRLVSDELDRGSTPAAGKPWLTDAATDLSWLSTPWSTMRHLLGAATEDEARARTEALAAGQVS
jgi:hypothetical protein